jgi:diacylglycerol O-acyltransferase
MKQLGILDSAFVNLEQTNTPQHVGGMGIYDPSTAPGGFVRFKDVIASFERRLGDLPLFRTRLVEVPGGLDRPYWIKDANFDVEFHSDRPPPLSSAGYVPAAVGSLYYRRIGQHP